MCECDANANCQQLICANAMRIPICTTSPTSENTVKAPNFGPLFQKGLLSLKRILQKNEENKICRNY
jgi:hypothetical protein